jgi:ferritin-like metal-binding protein YciE
VADKLSNARDLVLHLLGEALYIERRLAGEVLEELIRAVQDEELAEALRNHLEQTRTHVARAEAVFRSLDAEPSAGRSAAFEAQVSQHRELTPKIVVPRQADFFHAVAAAQTEHYEIGLYAALVEAVRSFGRGDAEPLEETLAEEREALAAAERALKRLAPPTA